MSWNESLVRVSNYEVETLQKRLAEIVDRRVAAELRLTMLEAEAEGEAKAAQHDAQATLLLAGFQAAMRHRRPLLQADIDQALGEEVGAREALAAAFETLKKYEHVAEVAAAVKRRDAARRETASLDEIGLRRSR